MITLQIPNTITALRAKAGPYLLGLACGKLLSIPILVRRHLKQDADFYNKLPTTSEVDMIEFIAVIDAIVREMRAKDGYLEPFPDDFLVDRKTRRPHRRAFQRYTNHLERAFKNTFSRALRDILQRLGLDRALTVNAWYEYSQTNVVFATSEDDWATWLKSECEELAMIAFRAGRPSCGELIGIPYRSIWD